MTRLYLVRHGVHDLVGHTLAGRMPGVHLGPEGHAQAGRLAAFFADRDVVALLSSPLERCRETAAPIGDRLALPVEIEAGLEEIDCGAWTGQDFSVLAGDPRWQAWNAERGTQGTPDGETMAAVQARVTAVVDRLAATDAGPAVLVSHSDVIKAAVLTLVGGPLDRHDRIEIEPASITTLDLWPGGGKVVRLNQVPGS